jgi:hypothetical protein
MTTITMKDLIAADKRWASPITGLGSMAVARALRDYVPEVKNKAEFADFARKALKGLEARAAGYAAEGKNPNGAAMKSTTKALAEVRAIIADVTAKPSKAKAATPVAEAPKATSRLTKAQLQAMIEAMPPEVIAAFLSAKG